MEKSGEWLYFGMILQKLSRFLLQHSQLKVYIDVNERDCLCWLVGIYTCSDDAPRRSQLKEIERREVLWKKKWVIIGDFNDLSSNEEKWGRQ